MKNLLPLLALLIPFSLFGKFPDLSLQINAGKNYLPTTVYLIPVTGEYRGHQSQLPNLPWISIIDAGIYYRLGQFQFGINGSFAKERFDLIVHRYKLYYSPGGNASGGDIYNNVVGAYYSGSLSFTGSYSVFDRNPFAINICSSFISSYLDHVDFKNETSKGSVNLDQKYQSITLGSQFILKKGRFDFYTDPQFQYVLHESSEIKEPFGFLLYCGVSFHLKKPGKPTENSSVQP